MEMCDDCPKMFELWEYKHISGDKILCEDCWRDRDEE